MTKVECAALTCKWCEVCSEKYGICRKEDIILKFRAAIDFPGKGTVIYLECLEIDYNK